MAFELTAEEKQRFDEEGWIGPFPAIDPAEGASLAPALRAYHDQTQGHPYPSEESLAGRSAFLEKPWYESIHTGVKRVSEIAQDPAVLDRVAQLIGNDVLLWGSCYFGQEQGQAIHWHADLEYQYWAGVSAWIALEEVCEDNVLKLLPGSHKIQETPETLMVSRKLDYREFQKDEFVLELAAEFLDAPRIERPAMKPGEFFLFTGRMWHGSFNPLPVYRTALNLRFAPATEHIRIPLNFLKPARWDPSPAPCMLLRGENRCDKNQLVPIPA